MSWSLVDALIASVVTNVVWMITWEWLSGRMYGKRKNDE
jgi:hypothetical protein